MHGECAVEAQRGGGEGVGMSVSEYIKPTYRFTEVNELMRLPLQKKIEISVTVIGEALKLCKHKAAIAFSGGKDSE